MACEPSRYACRRLESSNRKIKNILQKTESGAIVNRKDLKEFKYRKKYIKSKLEYLQEKETRVLNITQYLDGMPHAKNKTSYALENFIDEKNEILGKELEEFKEYSQELYGQLNELPPLYATILHENYINGKTLEEVSSIINYSYYKTCRLNGEALNEFDKLDKNKSEQKKARKCK